MTSIFRISSLALTTILVARTPLEAQSLAPVANSGIQETNPQNIQLKVAPAEGSALTVEVTDSAGLPVHNAAVTFRLPEEAPSGTFGNGTRTQVVISDAHGLAPLTGVRWDNESDLIGIRVTAVKGAAHAGLLVEFKSSAAGNIVAAAPLAAPPQALPKAQPDTAVEASNTLPDREEEVSALIQPGTARIPNAQPLAAAAFAPLSVSPMVSVVTNPKASSGRSHKTLYITIGAIAAAAAVGALFALKGSSGGSGAGATTPPTGIGIGSPSGISIGRPQ